MAAQRASIAGVLLCLIVVLIRAQDTGKPFRVGAMYGKNMGLAASPQQANIWGYTPDDVTDIVLSISPGGYTFTADHFAPGMWNVLFPMTATNISYTLTYTQEGQTTISHTNVVFGDVYFCSGQSNMALANQVCDNYTQVFQDAQNYPNIRIFESQIVEEADPQIDFPGALTGWGLVTSNLTLRKFSAVCYQYGKQLYDYNVQHGNGQRPIILIGQAVGGTPILSWNAKGVLDPCNATDVKGIWVPNGLWNAMVYPFTNTSIRGFLWYQGETEAINDIPDVYGCAISYMMDHWRTVFSSGQGDNSPSMPFLIVQLCGSGLCAACDAQADWNFAEVRWGQSNGTGLVPNSNQPAESGIIVTIDLGMPGLLHPTDKSVVGHRAAAMMMNVSYGIDVAPYQAPVPMPADSDGAPACYTYTNCSGRNGVALVLQYQYAEYGMVAPSILPGVVGFEAQRANGLWVLADQLKVYNGEVVVAKFHDFPSRIISAFRYAWRNQPCIGKVNGTYLNSNCPLVNSAGLPAAPWLSDSPLLCF